MTDDTEKLKAQLEAVTRGRDEAKADLSAAQERNRVLIEELQEFHWSECGCMDWRADPQCMRLYKIVALATPEPEGRP